jgi:hypothetical protein
MPALAPVTNADFPTKGEPIPVPTKEATNIHDAFQAENRA